MICSFFGHRDVELSENLYATTTAEIIKSVDLGCRIFYFGYFADSILGIIEGIAKAIDTVFGSNLASAVSGWRSGLSGMVDEAANKYGNGSYEKVVNELDLEWNHGRWNYGGVWDRGYQFGAEFDEDPMTAINNLLKDFGLKIEDLIPDELKDAIDAIGSDTANIEQALEITNENLKYLRDAAEQETINRFTTAEVRVEMTNNNNVSSTMDLDGVVDYMVTGVQEAMERVAEGVH